MSNNLNESSSALNRSNLLYRLSVGIVLFNNEGKVFVGERIDTPGAWQMPQGGIDPDESPEETALRELGEEVGTDKAEIIKVADRKIRYELPDNVVRSLWGGKYRGQEQIWVAAKFTGQDSDINLNSFDPPEFNAWQWVGLEQTLDLIVPFKRDVYVQIVELFKDIRITD